MKNKVVVLALATLGSAPALAAAAAAAVYRADLPPGPNIWAFIVRLFGG